ncbi:hypothetical protein [Aquipuribacter hungaricus]|uniref:Sigma-70 family RNA polymerase sigma factor n=1 Tax=Aquipuribacter hungaricus TaxID=545624 RepID=A0ABV7WK27_9MICO
MSVAEHLGLDDPDTSDLMHQAQRRWPDWAQEDPRLAGLPGPLQVPAWTLAADRAQADDVLHALASLAAVDGGNDPAAATTLCWSLLPAAVSVANELRGLTPSVDEAVAAQLWVEVRTFPWQRLRKVAANIRANTRVGVLRQCDDRPLGRPVDRTWSATCPVDPSAAFWAGMNDPSCFEPEAAAADELVDVLRWACTRDVISSEDRDLLLSLMEAAARNPVGRRRRGGEGLMSNALSEEVARGWGVSPVTVRRRTRRSVQALAQACRDGRYSDAA